MNYEPFKNRSEMREIKFRAWDTDPMLEIPEMYSWDRLNELDRDGLIQFFDILTGVEKYIKPMQYTGIKDKNGVEIYEGDVVKHEKWVRVGKYEPCIGVVKYKMVGFTCECIGDWIGSNTDLNGNAEVIGNIYENPELINI